MPNIQLPNIRLYYEERGEGVPILGIHGTGASAMTWESAVEDLARLGRVVTYDRRGYTRSERPEPIPPITVREYADDTAALLETLSATPAIVIGLSYGGVVATDLALRYPDHVRALALLEPALLRLTPEGQQLEKDLTNLVTSAAERGIDTVGETFLRTVLGDAAWEQYPDQKKRMFTDNGPAILAEFRGGSLDVDEATLATIDKPTLLVESTDSPDVFRQITKVLGMAIPYARTVRVSGGHEINRAHPVVLDFIREVLAGTGTKSQAA
jgi:esterase